jgi:NADPH:quinone reductase-like Zn-dependent oxidoreductase
MTFEEAASIPIASFTALSGLRKGGDLNGKTLLVNGATGGVGHFAVQIGRAKGARVTATCSTKNMDFALQLGASEIIDYTKENLAQQVNKFDMILDAFGKMKPGTARRLLNKKGVCASTLFMPTAMISSIFIKIVYGKKLTSAHMRAKPEDYAEIEELFSERKLKPFIGGIFSPEDARLAYEMIEHGRAMGKTIIKWD